MNDSDRHIHATVHRMTRWPDWKDSHLPGTYMVTVKVNGEQNLLGSLTGSTAAVHQWIKAHPQQAQRASEDPLYYRHASLGTKAMPFVLKETTAVETAVHKDSGRQSLQGGYSSLQSSAQPLQGGSPIPPSSCGGVSTPPSPTGLHGKQRTHFPIEALRHPDAPHIVLSPLGEKVRECLERMPEAAPQTELVCYAIMPNHLHAVIAVREHLPRSIGSVIRSFMGITSHFCQLMMKDGKVQWDAEAATITRKASKEKPSLWTAGYCIGVCQTEQRLHTCIGYVLENPFFGMLEKEQSFFMDRSACLSIAGRRYDSYGNILLLKEPERIQVFCHRRHPETGEPYEQTEDFRNEKAFFLEASAGGAVIVTPGISASEAEIMWAVLQAGGNVINIQQPVSDYKKWHPEKERRLYCSCGQLLVLAVKDLPNGTFHDNSGQVIPGTTKYAQFHLLNEVAQEICQEGMEHRCSLLRGTRQHNQQP